MPKLNSQGATNAVVTTSPAPIVTITQALEYCIVAVTNNGAVPVDFDIQWSVDGVTYIPANILELASVAAGETRYAQLTKFRPTKFKVRGTASSSTCAVIVEIFTFDAISSRY